MKDRKAHLGQRIQELDSLEEGGLNEALHTDFRFDVI